ncbi:MAG: Type 1 glutamine amidotransferase-like domain-containing protein [Eubacteriales bacterium]
MICFLTGSPCLEGIAKLNPANGFVEEVRKTVGKPCEVLFVCSNPDDYLRTDGFAKAVSDSFADSGIEFASFVVLDRRNANLSAELIQKSNLIILAGGHVPTQNRFFQEIRLRELLQNYDGVLIGISAGTMNCADTVYAQPELDGEAVSKEYKRFLPGLGLTQTMVLPHYQATKDAVLDGLRLFEDITYRDSVGRRFYALIDGSYILCKDGREELRGEAYLIADGSIEIINHENETLLLPSRIRT